jgi:ADP-ribose pyrophosphatase
MDGDLKPWPTLSSRQLGDYRVFTVRGDLKKSPITGAEHEFYVIQATNWVNVIPITKHGHIVMVEQYRHGSDTIELEVPGGVMDPTDPDPVATAVRELREETGYEGTSAKLIGQIRPNPAIMNNLAYTVLVEHCEQKHPLQFDHTEDIRTVLVNISDIPKLIRTNRISHSLVVVAFHHLGLHQNAQ